MSITTLTRLPLAVPDGVASRGAVLTYASAVGVLLAGATGGFAEACHWLFPDDILVMSALTLAALAWLTRGMHLDGLADTVDGWGPIGDRERSLAVMRQSDIGAFGVVALGLVALLDYSAIAWDLADNRAWSVGLAVLASRVALTWCGVRGFRAAQPDGLGAAVAESVPMSVATAWTAAGLGIAALPWAFGHRALAVHGLAAMVAAIVAGQLVGRVALGRLGGITGDVLGAAVEISLAVALVTTTLR